MHNQNQNQSRNQNQSQNQNQNQTQKEIQRLKELFLQSTDFTAKEIGWGQGEQAILCFYSSLVKKSEVERYVQLLRLEHKKAMRDEENKQKNSDSQQKGNKAIRHQKISSNTKYRDLKMIDISKKGNHQGSSNIGNQEGQQNQSEGAQNSDDQGSNGNENQTEQSNNSLNAQNTENQESNGNENLKEQQKLSESSNNDNQGSNDNENQTKQPTNSDSAQNSNSQKSTGNQNQSEQQNTSESTNTESQGSKNNENQKEQQQTSEGAPNGNSQGNNENQNLLEQQKTGESSNTNSQGSNNNENQTDQTQNSDSAQNNNNQGSNGNENLKAQQKGNVSTNNDNQVSSGSKNQTEQLKNNSESTQNSENQGSSNQVKQSDIQTIINIQKNNTVQSSSDIQAIIEQQKNNVNQNKSSSDNQSTSQQGGSKKNPNLQDENTSKQQGDNSKPKNNQMDSMTITTEPYDQQKIVEYICNGETIIILPKMQEILRVNSPEFPHRSPDEPENEQILRGAHEGLVEHIDSNISLVRKRIKNNKLIVKTVNIGAETKTGAYYLYLDDVVDREALKTVEERLQSMSLEMYYSVGQLNDHLDDNVWSPFPQLLNTERPDRVVANILEGKIAIMTDISPTAIIGPVTFFSFYQSPDDFNSRILTGTFYRVLRMLSLLIAIFLPAIYIAVVSFHFEVIPLELANKVKMDINQIPYRPLIEALIMEITIELIREASVRLPKSIGQTIGIVGGLVIGESIVSAGLVSNLMVIVVAFTAISSFVVPSIELNTAIRVLRFPIMFVASIFGFFGIMICTFILVIHLLNLSSYNQPYFSPLIPFRPKELKKVFFREPYYRANKQVTSFSPKKDDQA